MDVAPPSYAAPNLPVYSQSPHPEEIRVTASQSTSHPEEEYQYKNGHLILNLGPKRWRIFRPAYGWNGLVDGYVQIKANTKKVRSIVATIQGQVTTGVSERGFLSDQTRTVVLRASQTLFDSSSGEQVPKDGARYAFSFALPSYVDGGSDPLPPSFSTVRMGLAAEVTYFIKVDLIRKGKFRQNERSETPCVTWCLLIPD
jgi:Arrestin (or S-antigen), N-terminal domain